MRCVIAGLLPWVVVVSAVRSQSPAVFVVNDAAVAYSGVVPVSIPWPRGAHREVAAVSVGDDSAAPCAPLIRWPDGSIRVLRAWPRLDLAAGAALELPVAPRPEPAPESEDGPWLFGETLPARTFVLDPWGRSFEARLEPDASVGDGGWLVNSPRVRVRRYRGVHRDGDDTFLGARAYLTMRAGLERAELTVLLDNDPPAGHSALGPVRFCAFGIEILDESLQLRLRWAEENLLEPLARGPRRFLLGPSDALYLGDRTAKAFRFDVVRGEPTVLLPPLPCAMPTAAWTRHTRAFGAHGGPAEPIGELDAQAWQIEKKWRERARFGPFGDFGDPADSAANGTPRNGPCALHHVVQLRSASLLAIAESQVLQHTLRPTPGHLPRKPREWRDYRAGISSRTIGRPWGFSAPDYEHFSVDLLFDYYWLTADPLARDELTRMRSGLRPLLEGLPFETSRGEGWCLQAAVSISRALGDPDLLEWMRRRFVEQVLPEAGGAGQTFAIRQPPHEHALGDGDPFDAPWQMAALVHGLRALWDETGDERVAVAALRTAELMAGVGWVEGVGPKYVLSALDATRYRMPTSYEPWEGTAQFEVGAFVLAAELAEQVETEVDKGLLTRRADFLMEKRPHEAATASDRWTQIYLDRHR